ncbi:MAG: hypothetical protein AAGJ84_14375 [Pseudomonadota bacterium]
MRNFLVHIRLAAIPVLVFAVGFLILDLPLRAFQRATTPPPDMLVLSPKLADFKARADAFDVVFIGTSRTLYHIVPDEVEAGFVVAGCPEPSVYNFGVFGLKGAEQDWVVQQVMAADTGQLKTVIIETPLPEARDIEDATSTRARFFNDPNYLTWHIEAIFAYPESIAKQVFRLGIFMLGVSYDQSGIGLSAERLFPPVKGPARFGFDFAYDGFEALGSQPNESILLRRKEFVDNPEMFTSNLQKYGAASSEDVAPFAKYLANRLSEIEQAGLRSALFIAPDPAELDRTPRIGPKVTSASPTASVLNFNRPDIYPSLFERDLWYDESHLGFDGARQLSRMVGETLCQQQSASHEQEGSDDAVR